MKVRSLISSLGAKLRRSVVMKAGVAVLAGGMVFAGQAVAGTLVLSEDFEGGSGAWGGGAETFGVYGTGANYSGSPHSGVPGGGSLYGNLIGGQGASPDGGPLVSAAVDLTVGHQIIHFDGWLAGYTGDLDRTVFSAEFFDGLGGTGSSLGVRVLADGSSSDNVVDSVDGSGSLGGAWDVSNWSNYSNSRLIPAGAQSVTITYTGQTSPGNGNDAYADNIVITTVVPEPSTMLLGMGGLMLAGLGSRRKK